MAALGPTLKHEKNAGNCGFVNIAGVDESGRGPLAGPVVAAAVVLKKWRFRSRIDDCKLLSAKARLEAYYEITENSDYSICVINSNIVDKINILNATKLAMEKAVAGLSCRAGFLLIDGNMNVDMGLEGKSIIKGDRISLSIASASILAKVCRDRIMETVHRIYPEYGFRVHKGYATKMHLGALEKYGPTQFHRRSFLPLKGKGI